MLFATLDQKTTIRFGNPTAKGVTERKTTNKGSPEDHPAYSRATRPLPPLASTS
ncbi:hypothetical protein A2U01_0083075 [Trifolium medium]|uniref:Uncharacterized protein n=1 Tax=Trifolium medium TaxID=97028 RepID=A0A392TLI6_9FABA|nr:hypothetical protein [Trifolium medium]